MENDQFISMSHVSFSYMNDDSNTEYPVLKDVSLEIRRGEYIAVLGHNGSGKSTLAKLLNMILEPKSGTIVVDGREITSKDMTQDDVLQLRKNVGMVFQNPDNQLVATIVEEDVAFGPENLGLEPQQIRQRVDEALQTVGMSEYAKSEPHRLSGGQKQRVAIAGIIAMMPQCMIFDESTAMLDPEGRRKVLDTMELLNRERGITIINITHYMDEAARASRVIVLNDGEILMDAPPKEIFSRPEQLRQVGLDVPQHVRVAELLAKEGIDIPGDIYTMEGCADAIAQLYREKTDSQ